MPNPTLQDSIHDWQSEEGQTDATMLAGQLEVIAEELRTANLIAYQANVELSYVKAEAKKPRTANAEKLNAMILERLGLS